MVERNFLGMAAGLALLGGLMTGGAQAMPIAPAASVSAEAPVTLVRDGCGPGFFRTPYGRCRPAGGFRDGGYDRPRFFGGPGYDRRRFGGPGYGERRCVIRETYDGPRRICRH